MDSKNTKFINKLYSGDIKSEMDKIINIIRKTTMTISSIDNVIEYILSQDFD